MDEKILAEIIHGYRAIIEQRYQYDKLAASYELPDTVEERLVEQIKDYFLEYIYPNPEKRRELNNAFESLDDYVKHPRKLMRIVMDSSRLLFSHGVHLPKILNTGLKALNTFKAVSKFETQLLETAVQHKIDPPYGMDKISALIKFIPRTEIDQFIEGSKTLFETLHDRKMVKNIKEILGYLVKKMKEKADVYGPEEIRGIELGLEMVMKGDALFTALSKEHQQIFLDIIIQIEKDALDKMYSNSLDE